MNLFIYAVRSWLTADQWEEWQRGLRPPPTWRHPLTGLPYGWSREDIDFC